MKELFNELTGQLEEYISLVETFDDYAGRDIEFLHDLDKRVKEYCKKEEHTALEKDILYVAKLMNLELPNDNLKLVAEQMLDYDYSNYNEHIESLIEESFKEEEE